VLKFRSVNNIVIQPAKTGIDNNKRTEVTTIAQLNSDIDIIGIHFIRILYAVTKKFIAPNKDEVPDKCKLKINKSTELPE
jgi:hypothetical protein